MPNENKYKNEIKKEVKILGAIFTCNKNETSTINWELKIKKIDKIIKSYENRNLSLCGKVLLANSVLLSQLWHVGVVLKIDQKYINKIYKMLNKWFNGENGENIIKLLNKSKANGGMGLLNVAQRLMAIKVKSLRFMMAGKTRTELEFITYWAGTKFFTLSGKHLIGPKCENCVNDYGKTVNVMCKYKNQLSKIELLKVKDIEEIIFKVETNAPTYSGIYNGTSMKNVSLNFKIATNILKTAIKLNIQNRSCIYCKERVETIYHIFFECKTLEYLRKDAIKIIRTLRKDQQKLTWNYLVNMKEIKHKMEYEIISIYKKIIWNSSTKIRWGGERINITKLRVEMQKEIDFFARNIHNGQ